MTIQQALEPYAVALAPMAGVTNAAFRSLCRSFGPVYTVSEMVSAKALCYHDRKTAALLRLGAGEHPAAVQIFGSEPESMAEGAQRALALSGADVLDINMGCPTPKITKNGEGSALMRNPERAQAVARAVVKAVSVPVTVKLRLGWDNGSRNAPLLAQMLEDVGVAAIAVHGRTAAQKYSGRADWDGIAAVCRAVSIPVMANGDIFSPKEALRCRTLTGAALVMVGRAVFGRPWLPAQMGAVLRGEEPFPAPTPARRLALALTLFQQMEADKGERPAVLEMRKHLAWTLRGWRDCHLWRETIMGMETGRQVAQTIQAISRWVAQEKISLQDE